MKTILLDIPIERAESSDKPIFISIAVIALVLLVLIFLIRKKKAGKS